MFKNIFVLMLLGAVVAMPANAFARSEWLGVTDATWDYANVPANWTEDPLTGGYHTHPVRISYSDGGYDLAPGVPEIVNLPVIADGNNTTWGWVNIRNSVLVTQTGGYHLWLNGSNSVAFSLHNELWWGESTAREGVPYWEPATLHMTGGIHAVSGEASIGYDEYTPEDPGVVNIWGDGSFNLIPSGWHPSALLINDNSVIDIRENGTLRVPIELKEVIDAYLDGGTFTYLNRMHHVENNEWVQVIESLTVAPGRIVAGEVDHWLFRFQDGNEYVVVATDVALVPGDADQDGDVDDADATILASNWLTMSDATWAMGDFNFDRKVDETDASMLAANYGVVAPPASSVPEPGMLLLLCLGLGSLALVRRR